jgi:hypothetical protein
MRFLLLAACMPAIGCGMWNPFFTSTLTPADRARDLMPKCSNETGEGEGVGPAAIEQVSPLVSVVQSGNDRAIHLRGAELHMRPLGTLSPEGLQRRLECHEALVTLGRAEPLPDDPYVLDGTCLGVKVHSDGDAFIVSVQTDVLEQAKIVLARAERFGAGAGAARIAAGAGSAPASAAP